MLLTQDCSNNLKENVRSCCWFSQNEKMGFLETDEALSRFFLGSLQISISKLKQKYYSLYFSTSSMDYSTFHGEPFAIQSACIQHCY